MPRTGPLPSRSPRLGLLALLCFLLHAGNHVWRGTAHDILWFCTIGSLLVAIGLLWPQRWIAALGVSWIAFGTPMWLIDLSTGGELILTSFATHLVAPVAGGWWLRRVGWPPRTWITATGASLGLLIATRALTPPRANVNLAFAVAPSWEVWFPSHASYLAMLVAIAATTFYVVERVALTAAAAPARAAR